MRYRLLLILGALCLLCSCGTLKKAVPIESGPVMENPQDVSPNTLIIMYDTEVGKEPIKKAITQYGADIIYDYSIIPGMAIRIPDGKDIHEAIEYFKKVKGVVSVERDHIYHLTDPVKPHREVM